MSPSKEERIMSNEHSESNEYMAQNGTSGTELAEHDGEHQQMPIGVGGFGEQGTLPPLTDEGVSKMNSSAFIIAFVLLCTVGVIFFMRSTSAKHNSALAANHEVETEIATILETMIIDPAGNPVNDGTSVINALTEDRTQQQVSVEDVKTNPFILATDGEVTDSGPVQDDTPKLSELEKRRNEARQRIEDASKQISVNTIMSGSNPLASVNGKFVRVGDTIKVGPDKIPFQIEAIDSDGVELTAESEEFDLQLGFTVTLKR
jgi:hypothetical protein